jgi:dienelactone hydrolase
MSKRARLVLAALLAGLLLPPPAAQAQQYEGRIEITAEALALTLAKGQVVLPAGAAGAEPWRGSYGEVPKTVSGRWPLAIVMHGSSGIAPFITEYQLWLASLGIASLAPDSMAIPGRLTYKSPIPVEIYEQVHALRAAELEQAAGAARGLAWVDAGRIVFIGTSEGSVPVARSADPQTAGRILYAWSCERNYFVTEPRTAIPAATPVLNAIAAGDPYFAAGNPWNAAYPVTGSCAQALRGYKSAAVYIPLTDKHTIVNDADVRGVAGLFLRRVLALP